MLADSTIVSICPAEAQPLNCFVHHSFIIVSPSLLLHRSIRTKDRALGDLEVPEGNVRIPKSERGGSRLTRVKVANACERRREMK